MDHPEKSQPVAGGQMTYSGPQYQNVPMITSRNPPALAVPTPAQPPLSALANSPHQLTFPQDQEFNPLLEQMEEFWTKQMEEAVQMFDIKFHNLPLARIKKIMKADEDVRMISAEAPVVFAKACEMFILEMTLRSWIHTEENKRRTLQRSDVAAAISKTDIFDFLVDIISRYELKEDALGLTKDSPADMPCYFVPAQHHPMAPTGMMMEYPVDQAALYAGGQQPQPPPGTFMPWPPAQVAQQSVTQQQQQTGI
ncbi:hypothetical protein ACFE04_025326 [Oxalis oulophora]